MMLNQSQHFHGELRMRSIATARSPVPDLPALAVLNGSKSGGEFGRLPATRDTLAASLADEFAEPAGCRLAASGVAAGESASGAEAAPSAQKAAACRPRGLAAIDHCLRLRRQQAVVGRFEQHLVDAAGSKVVGQLRLGDGRDHENRRSILQLQQTYGQRMPVCVRHSQVGHYQVEGRGLGQLQAFVAVGGLLATKAYLRQGARGYLPHEGFVVHDERADIETLAVSCVHR